MVLLYTYAYVINMEFVKQKQLIGFKKLYMGYDPTTLLEPG